VSDHGPAAAPADRSVLGCEDPLGDDLDSDKYSITPTSTVPA
jgi:hypothetical protein